MTDPITNDSMRTDKAKLSPSRVFDRPQEVLLANDLSREEKRKILLQWKEDAVALQVAADENMAGGESTKLDEVVEALATLDKR
jgi:hypothetical protein